MIDLPSASPPEQVIEQKLVACGVDRGAISVSWQDDLQSIEIVIRRNARVSAAQFACFHNAASSNIMTFEDQALQAAYSDYTTELYRPQMIAEAKAAVAKLGLLDGFPRRSDHPDLRDYAGALERHCGLIAGSVLRVSGDDVYFDPPRGTDPMAFMQRHEKILAAIMYASAIDHAVKLSFIGNEAVADTRK